MQRITVLVASMALVGLVACSKESKAPAKAPAKAAKKAAPASKPAAAKKAGGLDDATMAKAQQVYDQRCATCHGPKGAGDGPAAAALNPKPRSIAAKAWQDSVDDAHIAKVIVKGGEAAGLSVMMAPNPDLENQPKVVEGLVKIVRGFAQ